IYSRRKSPATLGILFEKRICGFADFGVYAVPFGRNAWGYLTSIGGFMQKILQAIVVGSAMVLLTSFAAGQAPAQAPAGAPGGGQRGAPAPLASLNPIYSSIHLEIEVNKPAA